MSGKLGRPVTADEAVELVRSGRGPLAAELFGTVVELTKARALPPSVADCALVRAKGTKPQGAVAGIVQQLTDAVADHVQSM